MGCGSSKVDKEEIVQRCKERKKLMKQLVGFRAEFASAQMAYLRALKNTGVTLRQFTDLESLDLENTPCRVALPPSPPPPPPYSPDERRISSAQNVGPAQEECMEIDEDNCCTPPPPPLPNSSWDFILDRSGNAPPLDQKKNGDQQDEEEDWVDTKEEFEEDEAKLDLVIKAVPEKSAVRELMDDNSSVVSWYTRDTDVAMMAWMSKKSLAGIVKELDDYFLKASEGVKEIAILLDVNGGNQIGQNLGGYKGKGCKSAKVFGVLSWGWPLKSLQTSKDAALFHRIGEEACKPGSHCITLDKLYAEEQRLYEEVKKEECARLRYKRKIALLQKQEAEDHDSVRIDKTRLSIENLQSEILHLEEAISRTSSSILNLRDDELHPQIVELSSGLMQIWRTMYESHQVQNHIAQQMNHLDNRPSTEPTTDYHLQATIQLETEVTAWYNSFCNLLKSQRDYVRTLSQWIRLTHCLLDNHPTGSLSGIHALSDEWQLSLDQLPDKVASEAIRSFLSVIHSLVLQHYEERKLLKKSNRLESRLEKKLNLLREMENKFNESSVDDAASTLSPNHPLSVKRARIDTFKKRVEEEKSKYLRSVQASHAMMLNDLRTGLPNIFQALTGFSNVCMQAFEAIYRRSKSLDPENTFQFRP